MSERTALGDEAKRAISESRRIEKETGYSAAERAEKIRLGRELTADDLAALAASDPGLADARERSGEQYQRLVRANEIGVRNLEISSRGPQYAHIQGAPPAERTHAGLFLVSPLAWAIKKTWNGTPKRP